MHWKGGAMGKKLGPIILSAVITLYFLGMSIYELGTAFIAGQTGNIFAASQIIGWISFLFFLLSLVCLFLTMRKDSTAS